MATKRKTKATKKKKKSTRPSARDRVRQLAEDFERETNGENASGEGDSGYDKFTNGKNVRRILPAADPDDVWFKEFAVHYDISPNGRPMRCIEPNGPVGVKKGCKRVPRKCPACKEFYKGAQESRKHPFGSNSGLKIWRAAAKYKASRRFVFNSLAPKSDTPDKVLYTECGVKVMRDLVGMFQDDEDYGEFTDLRKGYNVIIKKSSTTNRKGEEDYQSIDYSVSGNPTRKARIRNWSEIVEELHDLEEVAGKILSPKDFRAVMDGEMEDEEDFDDDDDFDEEDDDRDDEEDFDDDDDEEDEDDDDDEDEDDDDEEDFDDDDDEEDDEEDDDEDDEADEPPSKRRRAKKKSSTRDKLKKRGKKRRR